MTDEREVLVPTVEANLRGDLRIPAHARAVVLFAHGSGSSRRSPRNRAVAAALNERGLATLLLDLLTPEEEAVDVRTREHRFDIRLLADRLTRAASWLDCEPATRRLPLGCFGASTGAAAALIAAALLPRVVHAVVSRGGRPDLAGDALEQVCAPTLLIVGGRDPEVVDLNLAARDRLRAEADLAVVPGATHLFEEPGALDRVAEIAGDWFLDHLAPPAVDHGTDLSGRGLA